MKHFMVVLIFVVLASSVLAVNPTILPFFTHVEVGQEVQLNTKVPAGTQVFWKVTNPNIAQILEESSERVRVRGLKAGQTSVTFKTDTGRRASAMLYVGSIRDVNQPKRKIAPERVLLTPTKTTVAVGHSIDFFAKRADDRVFEWSVEDPKVLKLVRVAGNRAQVKALAPGITHVTAKAKVGTIGDSLIKVVAAGRTRHAEGMRYFEPGPLQGLKSYARKSDVTIVKPTQ